MNQPQTACRPETPAGQPRSATWSDSNLFTPPWATDERMAYSGVHARPNTARVLDYLLGGKDNFSPDRELAHRLLELVPGFRASLHANRRFVMRAARHLVARRGVRQFLEIGVGYPGQKNVHEVAQRIAADARVVYIDDDPVVLAHGRALLATNDRVRIVEGHLADPNGFLGHRITRGLIDFTRPVAILMAGNLQFVPPGANPYGIVAQMRSALSPGSWLVISHPVIRPGTAPVAELFRDCLDKPQSARTKEQIAAFFDKLDLEPPGLVPVSRWRPGRPSGSEDDGWFYAGAGRVVGPEDSY